MVGDEEPLLMTERIVFAATVALTRDIQLSPWLSWYRGILVADRLLVVVRFPAGPRVRLTWRPAERHRALAKKRS